MKIQIPLGLLQRGTLNTCTSCVKFIFCSIEGVPLDQLDPSLFAKARAGKGRDNVQKQKEIGALEAQIYHLTEILGVSYCLFLHFSIFSHSAQWDL